MSGHIPRVQFSSHSLWDVTLGDGTLSLLGRQAYRVRNYYLSWVAGNWVINLWFVHPQKAGEHNFFHPVSRNPWEVIISGPVQCTSFMNNPQ